MSAATTPTQPKGLARTGQPDSSPTFESVRQDIEAAKSGPQTEPTIAPDMIAPAPLADPVAILAPVVAIPVPVPQPLLMPQAAVATTGAFPQAPATKPVGVAAMATAPSPSAFFDDTKSTATDAADFAADLLAALGSSTAPAPLAELKTSSPIDAPITTDVVPELDMTSDAWLDQLARDITATASADNKLSFRIAPPQLGRLDINIEARDAGVAVHMKAETREAQAIITAAQPRLESTLSQNGIRVTETSVASNGQENLPKPHFIPQKALIEAVNDLEHEADTPTMGRAAGRFA